MPIPPAIIFINADINDQIVSTLTTQLNLDETMSFDEFNTRVSNDPNYPTVVHLWFKRILVILPNLMDQTNRTLADLVLFYNQGQVTVEKNKFGPPRLSLPLQRVNLYELLRYEHSPYVIVLPPTPSPPHHHHHLEGIVADEFADSSGVYAPNPDNEYNNKDFINRK